jgi:ABC-type dipeptide/oligopeptide/nickel transport system permease component
MCVAIVVYILGICIVVWIAVVAGPLITWFSNQWWAKYVRVGIVIVYAFGIIAVVLLTFGSDWRAVGIISSNDVKTREGIADKFKGIRTEYWRGVLVSKIATLHKEQGTKPTGEWPGDMLPGAYGESSVTALARMDEKWRGLDR